MRCPVLTRGTGLRLRYAMSGTEIACGATRCGASKAPRRLRTRRSYLASTSRLQSTNAPMLRYAISLRCCYAMSGTETENGCTCLRTCYAMSGTELAYDAISTHNCYAVSGTKLPYDAICLCACYARAMRCPVLTKRCLRSYATPGTEIPYGTTLCTVPL
eukprot:3941890-Rhodomonas_salina.2